MDRPAETPTDDTVSPATGRAAPSPRKRSLVQTAIESPGSDDARPVNRRKTSKVSRACDHCKQRKAKCSGTLPCAKCTRRGLECLYDARYSRGRPPTPPPSRDHVPAGAPDVSVISTAPAVPSQPPQRAEPVSGLASGSGLASRASPELGMAEIEGQVFDPTSGVTFLHRAWKRLARHDATAAGPPEVAYSQNPVEGHPVALPGDLPLPLTTEEDARQLTLPPYDELSRLLALYFDVCIATYRIIHRPSAEAWLEAMVANLRAGRPAWHDMGRARASIVLACLAVATTHSEKSRGLAASLERSDRLFGVAAHLTDAETGAARLESAQTRIVQTLYLLTTSRMNRAWYTFGSALQIISALGLHRRAAKKRGHHPTSAAPDYVLAQFRMRTFWTAYVLDKYLGVIFGRPRHYHDDDIDQELPDRVEDEDMTVRGPTIAEGDQMGCHIDALIFHIRIARIIGQISRDVYSIKPISQDERISAAHRLSRAVHEWKASLPPYLGAIRPSMLITSFRRQSIVLRIAHAHAMMHANRLFLLAPPHVEGAATQVAECIGAARAVLDTIDGLAAEGPIFHAFWWTHYVTFCALVVTYVWDIQLRRRGIVQSADEQAAHAALMELARRCQMHLAQATATNSPSRRYAVILEEFRSEAMAQKGFQFKESQALGEEPSLRPFGNEELMEESYGRGVFEPQAVMMPADNGVSVGYNLLDEWNTADWLDLDSSAFEPYMMDLDVAGFQWMPEMGM